MKKLSVFTSFLARTVLSRTYTVLLLLIFLVATIASQMLPAFLGGTELLGSWWYQGLLILIIFNSVICGVVRAYVFKPHDVINGKPTFSIRVDNFNFGELTRALKAEGFTALPGSPYGWVGVKGKYGYWGSLVFHFSLGIVGFGIMINNLFGMSGGMAIPIGHSLFEEHVDYVGKVQEGKFFRESHAGFSVTLNSLDPRYSYGNKTFSSLEGNVTIRGVEGTLSRMIRPNQGLSYAGRNLMLGNFGVAPTLGVYLKGIQRQKSVVTLSAGSGTNGGPIYNDTVLLPNTPITAKIKVYPEGVFIGERLMSRTSLLKNPLMQLELFEDNYKLRDGILKVGEGLVLDNGLEVRFEGIKYYGFLKISYLPGLPILYFGLFLGLAGLGLTMLVDFRLVLIDTVAEGHCDVTGWAYHYKASFQRQVGLLLKNLNEREG